MSSPKTLTVLTFLSVVLGAFVSVAQADTVPHFFLNQGTITLTRGGGEEVDHMKFSLSGVGVSISGMGTAFCDFCFTQMAPPGTVLTPSAQIPGSETRGTITIGSVTYSNVLFDGGVSPSGSSFALPALSGTDFKLFKITLPVVFTTSLTGCTGAFSGCPGGDDIATFSSVKNGKVVLTFFEDGEGWTWSSAEYKLAAVPEPGTLALVASGALGLAGHWFRRKIT